MAKTSSKFDSRTSFDQKTGALRSIFNPEDNNLEISNDLDARTTAENFLDARKIQFDFNPKTELYFSETCHTPGLASVRFKQIFKGLPVFGAIVTVNIRKLSHSVISAYSNFDYEIPDTLSTKPRKKIKDALARLIEKPGVDLHYISNAQSELVLFHDNNNEHFRAPQNRIIEKLLDSANLLSIRTENTIHLAWRLLVSLKSPIKTTLEIFIDAQNGELVQWRDLSQYVGRGLVFSPDPATSSRQSGFASCESSEDGFNLSPNSKFDKELVEVPILGLEEPQLGEPYRLVGEFCRIEPDRSPPYESESSPQEYQPDFRYWSRDPKLLSVMAYYWTDTAGRYLQHHLGVEYSSIPAKVDPCAEDNDEISSYDPCTKFILLGKGWHPDAADAAVILHEYAHFIQDQQSFLGPEDLMEGCADGFSRIFLDRFCHDRLDPTLIFPFEANLKNGQLRPQLADRRVTELENYLTRLDGRVERYERGSLWTSFLWTLYQILGGESKDHLRRLWAADVTLRLHMEANICFGKTSLNHEGGVSSHQIMAEALKAASYSLAGFSPAPAGLLHKIIDETCSRSGLAHRSSADVFIPDGRESTYDFVEDIPEATEGLRINQNPDEDENPEDAVEVIPDETNYLWVLVQQNGQEVSGKIKVQAFHVPESTHYFWPDSLTDYRLSEKPIVKTWPAGEDGLWVGPFRFVPKEENRQVLVAIVSSEDDPAVTETLPQNEKVDPFRLVMFDNNIAQRTFVPKVEAEE